MEKHVKKVQQQLPRGISWVKTNIKNIPKNAFIGGWEDGGKRNVYIGRTEFHGCVITGKVIEFWGGMFFPLGNEHKADSFEVLVADDLKLLKWIPARGSRVPKGAIQGGFQGDDPLFIARGKNPAGEPTPGKLHPPHGFFLSWGGGEHQLNDYEVLVCEGVTDVECTPADENQKGSVKQELPEGASWVETDIHNIPRNAFIGGYEDGGKRDVYVGRAEFRGNLMPGKTIPFWGGMFFPLFGREIKNEKFEVLVTDNPGIFRWVPASSGQVPQGAVQGGYQDGGPLFIARGKNPAGEPTPGKLHPPHGFFLSWGGKEHHPLEYEVLVCDGISDVLHTGEQSARHTPDAPPDYMHTMMEKSLEKLEKLDKLDHVIRLLEKVDSRLDDMDNKIDKLEKWISKRD